MFSIATDTSANLDCRLAGKYGLTVIPFSYYVNGEENTCTDTVGFDGAAFAEGYAAAASPSLYLEGDYSDAGVEGQTASVLARLSRQSPRRGR